MIRIAINGFGRIGRAAFKIALTKKKLEVVAINNPGDVGALAHLLKYDTVYGVWPHEVRGIGRMNGRTEERKNLRMEELKNGRTEGVGQAIGAIVVDKKRYPVFGEREPQALPWKRLKVDVVLECTGRFTKNDAAKAHIEAGAKKVIVSAPTKGGDKETEERKLRTEEIQHVRTKVHKVGATFLLGVNAEDYQGQEIISNASCTTNCIAPVTKVIADNFGIKKAMMTTVHAVTAEQNLVDSNPPALKPDLRRARSALVNIVPTTTGAASALGEVIPEVKGKFDGMALRVPVLCGSLSDFTFVVQKKVTVEQVNQAFKRATRQKQYHGILAVTEDPIVSSDIVGRTESSIVDLSLTKVVDGDLVKVLAWYDNEWGYANRLVEMVSVVTKELKNGTI